jgi:hypothetical protein
VVHLDAVRARAREHFRRAARAVAPVAGQAEDRVRHDEQPGGARAARRVEEFGDGVQPVDLGEQRSSARLEPELDPHRDTRVPLREHRERFVRQRVRARCDAERDDARSGSAPQMRLDDREHLAQALDRDVGVRVRLEVRDHAGVGRSRAMRASPSSSCRARSSPRRHAPVPEPSTSQ